MIFLLSQMNVITFQCKASTEKMNIALTSKNCVTYPDNNFLYQNNTCAFFKKTFHEILTFQKNVNIFQSKASRDKMNTALTSTNTLTYPKVGFLISE